MGFNYRKSKKIGPFRVTASKSGISTSVGGKGYRVTRKINTVNADDIMPIGNIANNNSKLIIANIILVILAIIYNTL